MTFFNYVFQLLMISTVGTHYIPLDGTNKETHTFRWSTSDDLNNSICAMADKPPRYENNLIELMLWGTSSSEDILSFFFSL